MGTYYSARACESVLLVRKDSLGEIEEYLRAIGMVGRRDRLDLEACETAQEGTVMIWPSFGDGESLFLGDVPYIMDERIAAFMAAWCLAGSRFEWLDEDEMVFGRISVDAEGSAREELMPLANPFYTTPPEQVVESVDWECVCSTLGIDRGSVDKNTADEVVARAVRKYRDAVDECMGDTRSDIFLQACKETSEARGVRIPFAEG